MFIRDRFEIPAHKWVDVYDGKYGVAILNDCKYGHRVKDGLISLNCLRSPDVYKRQLMMGVGSLLVSLFIDRSGTSKSMTIGMVGYFIAGILGYTAQSFTPMLIARLITGLCNGFVIVCRCV